MKQLRPLAICFWFVGEFKFVNTCVFGFMFFVLQIFLLVSICHARVGDGSTSLRTPWLARRKMLPAAGFKPSSVRVASYALVHSATLSPDLIYNIPN